MTFSLQTFFLLILALSIIENQRITFFYGILLFMKCCITAFSQNVSHCCRVGSSKHVQHIGNVNPNTLKNISWTLVNFP